MSSVDESRYGPIFAFVPALYPVVLEILHRHSLTGPVFFALSYAKHYGVKTSAAGHCVLHSDLAAKVQQATAVAESSVSRFITEKLVNPGLVRKYSIPEKERRSLFKSTEGHNTVVGVTQEGLDKLDRINSEVIDLMDHLVSGSVSRAVITMVTKALKKHEPELLSRLAEWTSAEPRA